MGKLFRYGLAAAVVMTSAFSLTAIYAIRHPDSYLTKYGVRAVNLGMEPLIQVGQTIIEKAGRAAIRMSVQRKFDSHEPSFCLPGEPQVIEETVPAQPELLPPVDNQIIQAVREQLPPISFVEDKEPPLADEPKSGGILDTGKDWIPLIPESVLDSAVDIPGTEDRMPRCFDDDEDPPPRMPRADQAELGENSDALFQFWMNLFRGPAEEMDGLEESESVNEESLAPCQEDPAYHYQYPGCPFTGKCPFGNEKGGWMKDEKAFSPVHRSSFICPAAPLFEKEKRQMRDPDMDPRLLHVPERLKRMLPQAGSAEEEEGEPTPEPNVDTTEFRPSDARPGEFDPKPM